VAESGGRGIGSMLGAGGECDVSWHDMLLLVALESILVQYCVAIFLH
jgi:hypothetical protein